MPGHGQGLRRSAAVQLADGPRTGRCRRPAWQPAAAHDPAVRDPQVAGRLRIATKDRTPAGGPPWGTIGDVTELELLRTTGTTASLRRAVLDDVPSIVALLTDDVLGASREGMDGADGLEPYVRAFEALDADAAHLLLVAEAGGSVAATMQLSFIPGLARRGALRAQIEGVRVRPDRRSSGLGRALVMWARDEAERRGCALVQLTSDKQRPEAHRFYTGLGFAASHEGFKLELQVPDRDTLPR